MDSFQRLLVLVKMLEHGDEPSVDQLAKKFHASPRTIFRDIRKLREMGFEIETLEGRFVMDEVDWEGWLKKQLRSRRRR